MRFSHLLLMALVPLAFAGCRAGVSAQAAPDVKRTEDPLNEGATVPSSASTGASNGLEVSIAALESSTVYRGSKSPQPRGLTYFSPDDPHIDVVLRNISAQPISVHQEWNSWGYSNLSLEITKIDGKTLPKPIMVQRVGGAWLRNFPEAQTIAPGESIVREVHFPSAQGKKLRSFIGGDGYYSPFPFKKGFAPVYTMRAVFQDSQTDHQQYAPPAWTGKTSSPSLDYAFR